MGSAPGNAHDQLLAIEKGLVERAEKKIMIESATGTRSV